MKQLFDPAKILNTPRLTIRFLEENDADDLFCNISHDKDVLKYFLMEYDEYNDQSRERTLRRIEGALKAERYLFSVQLKETKEIIGMILQCSVPGPYSNATEIGYAFGKKYWNQGYATEALQAMIDFCSEIGIHRITCCHIIENSASGRVMQKCGMQFEGIFKDELEYNGRYWDTAHYSYIVPSTYSTCHPNRK